MSRLLRHPLLTIVLGLAMIGIGYQLVHDPFALLMYLLIGAAVAVGMYFLFTRVIMKKITMNQYRASVPRSNPNAKQMKVVKSGTNKKPIKKRPSKSIHRRRKEHNLTVIEGKKNRKKNRALF